MCSASQFLLVYIKMNLLRLYLPYYATVCRTVPVYKSTRTKCFHQFCFT